MRYYRRRRFQGFIELTWQGYSLSWTCFRLRKLKSGGYLETRVQLDHARQREHVNNSIIQRRESYRHITSRASGIGDLIFSEPIFTVEDE